MSAKKYSKLQATVIVNATDAKSYRDVVNHFIDIKKTLQVRVIVNANITSQCDQQMLELVHTEGQSDDFCLFCKSY